MHRSYWITSIPQVMSVTHHVHYNAGKKENKREREREKGRIHARNCAYLTGRQITCFTSDARAC